MVGVCEAVEPSSKEKARTSELVSPKELSAAARMPLNKLVNIGVALRWQSGGHSHRLVGWVTSELREGTAQAQTRTVGHAEVKVRQRTRRRYVRAP